MSSPNVRESRRSDPDLYIPAYSPVELMSLHSYTCGRQASEMFERMYVYRLGLRKLLCTLSQGTYYCPVEVHHSRWS